MLPSRAIRVRPFGLSLLPIFGPAAARCIARFDKVVTKRSLDAFKFWILLPLSTGSMAALLGMFGKSSRPVATIMISQVWSILIKTSIRDTFSTIVNIESRSLRSCLIVNPTV